MAKLLIDGEHKLAGKVYVNGNKNSALKLLAAALLTDGVTKLTNCPIIHDVSVMGEIVRELGAQVDGLGTRTISINAKNINSFKIGKELSGRVRTAPLLIAPLLLKFGKAEITTHGGCSLGLRLLSTHFKLLADMGALIKKQNGGFLISYKAKPKNRQIFLEEASVTATELGLLLASGIPAETTILDAACEPHVADLAQMLTKMGAKIYGAGTNIIKIVGTKNLKAVTHMVGYDHVEAGTWAILAAATGSRLTIKNTPKEHMGMVCAYIAHFGVANYFSDDTTWEIIPSKLLFDGSIKEVQTRPWPGFPTDLMSPLIVLATQTKGPILCHDWMFEWRMFFVDDLIKMGAKIIVADPHRVVVLDSKKLKGSNLVCKDIRAGMAMVIAALCAKGKSEIEKVEIIERGYEDLVGKLKKIGAKVERLD